MTVKITRRDHDAGSQRGYAARVGEVGVANPSYSVRPKSADRQWGEVPRR